MTRREIAIAAPLLAFAILFGVYPNALFNYMTPTVNRTVDNLTVWMRNVKEPRLRKATAEQTPPAATVASAGPAPRALEEQQQP